MVLSGLKMTTLALDVNADEAKDTQMIIVRKIFYVSAAFPTALI